MLLNLVPYVFKLNVNSCFSNAKSAIKALQWVKSVFLFIYIFFQIFIGNHSCKSREKNKINFIEGTKPRPEIENVKRTILVTIGFSPYEVGNSQRFCRLNFLLSFSCS